MSGQATAPTNPSPVIIRPASPQDVPKCGEICHGAFHGINTRHGFPADFPGPEAAVGLLSMMFSHPGFYCVVAESDGQIVGSNCLDERSTIAGVGPITVDPETQNRGVGRQLMRAVLDRARERGFAGVRLVQAAFHNRSLSLYVSLGFDVREPLAVMQRQAMGKSIEGCSTRPAKISDMAACDQICSQVHGHDRSRELGDAIEQGSAVVAEQNGRIIGYSAALAFFGHSVAETNLGLQTLIASAETFAGPGILVPTRNAALFRWCLENGLRVVEPMTLMSLGLYNEPAGAFLPSILF